MSEQEAPQPQDNSGESAASKALKAAQEAIKAAKAMNTPAPAAAAPKPAPMVDAATGQAIPDDLAAMFAEAAAETAASNAASSAPAKAAAQAASASAQAFALPDFSKAPPSGEPSAIDLLSDVSLNVKIELGRTRMLVEDVLRLSEGTVVELDKVAGDPVDIFVNDRHVARGEVLVLNDNFCVRVSEILTNNLDK